MVVVHLQILFALVHKTESKGDKEGGSNAWSGEWKSRVHVSVHNKYKENL